MNTFFQINLFIPYIYFSALVNCFFIFQEFTLMFPDEHHKITYLIYSKRNSLPKKIAYIRRNYDRFLKKYFGYNSEED